MLIPLDTLDFSLPDLRTIPPPPEADQALRRTIAARGVLQPILVRPLGNKYQVVLGRRRSRFSIELGLPEIPAECRDMTEVEAIEAQIIETIQREAMHPVDQWKAAKLLLDAGSTVEDAAMAFGLDARAAQRMALLAMLHPDVEALIQTDMPNRSALGAIALASPEQQAAALKVPYAAPDGQPNWVVIANACRRSSIPRGFAIFDVDTAAVAFEEDLFAEPGAPNQFVTRDTAGFLAAQTAALQKRVTDGRADGHRIQLAGWQAQDIKVPSGWTRRWTEPPKTPPTGDTGQVLLVAISHAPHNFGAIVEALADPPRGTPLEAPQAHAGNPPRQSAPQARRGIEALTTGTAKAATSGRAIATGPDPVIDPEALSKRGQTIIAEAKTAALRDHLRHPPGAYEGLSLLTRCLLLALAGDNVDVRGSKYQSAELGHLVPLLVDPAGDLIELSDAAVLDLLGEVLARMLAITDQATDFGSGLVAEYIGHALDVPAPRLDTAEFLATLHGEELRKVSQAHLRGSVVHTTVVALRNYLVGKLPNWRPAVFGAPGPASKPAPRRRAPAKATESETV